MPLYCAPVQIKLQSTWSGKDWSCPLITVCMHQWFSFINQLIQR